MNTLNRRKFLSSSALLATSSLISVTANAACKDPMPAKWDEEVDVIVVGSGFAGLAAAAEAKNANAGNVIVLEKMRAPGGNSVINGGIFAVPGNPAQVKLGIKDSPELLASDMIAAGLGYGYPEKIKAMTEEALPTYEWTVKELGVQYNDKVGHSVPRHVSAIVVAELSRVVQRGKNCLKSLAFVGRGKSRDIFCQKKERIYTIDVADTVRKKPSEMTVQPFRFSYQREVVTGEPVKETFCCRERINIKISDIRKKKRNIRTFKNIGLVRSHSVGIIISCPDVFEMMFVRAGSVQSDSDSARS